MDLLQTILALLLTLGILVTVHEAGHFFLARYFGVRVLRFSLGMGPVLWRRQGAGGTEFALSLLPIGGYVKMLEGEADGIASTPGQRAFSETHPAARIAIALGGPVANLLLAVLVYWVLFVSGVTGLVPYVKALEGAEGPALGARVLAVDGQETPHWNAVNEALVRRLGESGQITFTLEGDRGPWTLERPIERWLADAEAPQFLSELKLEPAYPVVLGRILEGSPAEAAGLRPGDRITAVNERAVEHWRAFVDAVQAAGSETLTLNLDRGGEPRRLTVQPRLQEGKGFLGVGPAYAVQRWGPGEAVGEAVMATWDKTAMTLGLVKKMVQGLVSTRNLSGPITIAKVAGDSAKSGVETFLGFLALLSVSLAVLNLLPIPVLDGGHVVLHVLEWVRGAPLPERVQALGVQVGLMLVVSLMALALINDFSRL